jgi:hypothetical protein
VEQLLAEHGLSRATEDPLANAGYSGSALSRIVREDGAAFVMKRMSIERDWIMRATDDVECREAAFASMSVDLGLHVRPPTIGVARDGEGYALLMRDITEVLLPDPISEPHLEAIIQRMAEVHSIPPPRPNFPWCDVRRRLLLLTPAGATIADDYGTPVARDLLEGWTLFDRHASPRARAIIRALFDDASPLLGALAELPSALLHGDMKLDNIGLDADGCMWLIDWAMTLVAPPAIELGWFLAINSRRVPASLDEIMRRYAEAANMVPSQRERHDALTAVCGLLLRGWRKALDAEAGEPDELRWWCERVEAAAPLLRA